MSESVEFSVEEWKRRQKNSMWKINLVSKMRVEKCQVCKEQWQDILIKLVNIHIYDEDSSSKRKQYDKEDNENKTTGVD